jgi:hypothetical protein
VVGLGNRLEAAGLPRSRLLGVALLVLGMGLAFGVQALGPVGVPLYDGQPVVEPYRFLHPTGDQAGDPTSFSLSPALQGADTPAVPAATSENPPQAQLIAQKGAFVLTSGATGMKVSITPIDPPASPAAGDIAGNVYRFTVTDQAGTNLAIKACDGCISLVIRAPDGIGDARLQRFSSGAWVDVETFHAGIVGMYATNPVVLGDYAIVTGSGTATSASSDERTLLGLPFDQVVVAGGAALVLVLLFAAALLVRTRDSTPAPARSRAIPSKRKKPKPRSGSGPGRPDR